MKATFVVELRALAEDVGIDIEAYKRVHGTMPSTAELFEILQERRFEAVPLSEDELLALGELPRSVPHSTHNITRLYYCSLCNPYRSATSILELITP